MGGGREAVGGERQGVAEGGHGCYGAYCAGVESGGWLESAVGKGKGKGVGKGERRKAGEERR
jgi:hypothetical protein